MPLVPIEFFEEAIGCTIEEVLYKMQFVSGGSLEGTKTPTITLRTLKNWRAGKTAVRKSAFHQLVSNVEEASDLTIPDRLLSEDAFCMDHPGPQTASTVRWHSFLDGIEWVEECPLLWVDEARRLLTVSLEFKAACAAGAGHIAAVIEGSGLPETAIFGETVKFLRRVDAGIAPPDQFSMIPLYLETVLYLLACYDVHKGFRLLPALCRRTNKDPRVAPVARVIDKFREILDVSSDLELGKRLLPGQDHESARNEIRKWRRGTRSPGWDRIGQWSRDIEGPLTTEEPRSYDIVWTIAFAKIIDHVAKSAHSVESDIEWFNTEMLFQNLELLNEHATARAHSSSPSSGRSSPRDS